MRTLRFSRRAARLALALGCTLAAPFAAQAQTTINNNAVYTTNGGFWMVSPGGRVSYCTASQTAYGQPTSRCNVMGSFGNTLGWTGVVQTGNGAIFGINRQTGAIVSCTVVLVNGTNPTGGCAQVSTLAALQ